MRATTATPSAPSSARHARVIAQPPPCHALSHFPAFTADATPYTIGLSTQVARKRPSHAISAVLTNLLLVRRAPGGDDPVRRRASRRPSRHSRGPVRSGGGRRAWSRGSGDVRREQFPHGR